jgi:hypothetical protein
MKRLVILLPVLLAFQVGVQPALAWTWPVDGPVLRPFSVSDDPYGAGQHRGVDVAGPAGAPVRAPAGGTISFAGAVPRGGLTITIETADGYSVTLLHLGALAAARSQAVEEGERLGAVGSSGDPEHNQPYVHLGVRLTADPHGYVDPLTLLPPRTEPVPETPPEPAPEPDPASAPTGREKPDRARPAARHAPVAAPSARPRVAQPRVWNGEARPRSQQRPAPRTVTSPLPSAAPVRTALTAFEQPAPPTAEGASRQATREANWLAVWGLAALAAAGAAAGALLLRRQLRDARAADEPPAVLLEAAAATAEDAGSLRLREEDGLVLDRDLERVLLAEPEALADLDRDDDTPELVKVADDARRHPACRPGRQPRRLFRPHRPRAWPFSAEAHA